MSAAPEPALLPVVRAADLDEVPANASWLVQALWARAGVGILGGAPKCCKSWLGLDLALSVASDTPCLDTFAVHDPGAVLVYLAEDATSVVKQRLLGMCAHRGLDLAALPVHVITANALRLDLTRDQVRLRHTVKAIRPRLLLLDPFVRLHRVDENDSGEVSALLGYLRELQRESDVAVLIVHHARKNGGSVHAPGQSLRGSGDLHAWGDSNLYLHRRREGLLLSIEHRAAHALDPIALQLDIEAQRTRLCVVGADATDDTEHEEGEPRADLATAVLAAIDAAEAPPSRRELRAALRVRNQRLGPVLDQLLADGRAVRVGDRWVRPTVPVPDQP